jgi:acetylornithine deacetylase/succinyl-diaminopimelate desuccinylase family protein
MNAVASLLRDLVRLPSVNPMGRTVDAQICYEFRVTDYLEAFFKDLKVPYERQTVAPGRDNIVARYDAGHAAPTLVLEAHQDTVPVTNMIIEPFGGHVEGNRLYGRGSCDIKGGMTAMLTAFARLSRERPARAANVIMACTVDEEHTFLGVQELVKRGLKADYAVVAEPTNLNIVNAHKGIVRWFLSTTGRSCHSSKPEQGVNAIYRMARVVAALERYAQTLSQTVVDPLLGPATLSIGIIQGGSAVNTVPDRCTIEIDRRLVGSERPLDAPQQMLDYLRKEGIDFPLEQTPCWIAERALMPARSEEIAKKLGAAIDSVRGSHRIETVPFGTDAATISFSGIPAVIFGPGDIAQAHTNDEWVPLDEIEQAAEILYRLASAGG